ncbi:hypothetical protein SAMN05216207_104737 [Pseudonocardia ammonioxydans]|uniref:TrbC/VIRB2 family protein n=1 Tax=Pseudonocardia ammonioxydans TaxID=260086 RepID=A0A1I5GK31_PSUAM|nr:hypothetical protein [Pseudonocardia ammonioxydans]SFO36293.1 hypothetical protein SAMN05216207_104737 [Pseudonocardia ammonioxydans]
MSQLLSVLDVYSLPQSPPPLIPNPDPGQLPGKLGENANTIIATMKGVLLVLAVGAGLIGVGLIMAGAKNRSGYAVSGIEKIGMVLLGIAVMGALPSIFELVV